MGFLKFWSRGEPQAQPEQRAPARVPAPAQNSGKKPAAAPAPRQANPSARQANTSPAANAARPNKAVDLLKNPEAPPSEPSAEPAQNSSTENVVRPRKKYQAITKKDDIPYHASVMSATGGHFSLEPQLQKYYAVLLVSKERKEVYLVVSTEIDQSKIDDDFFAISSRLDNQGYSRRKILANPEILSIIYEAGNASRSSEDQQRQATQIQIDFDDLLRAAVEADASDIHIEVRRSEARVRFRKDGNLYEYRPWPVRYARMIASVIYQVIADEKDPTFDEAKPQDAIIDRELSESLRLRVRLATLPAYPAGFDMIMRLLKMGQDGKRVSLDKLGYEKLHLSKIRRAVDKPVGAVIMAGTTGSGKSTSLNSMVGEKIEHNKGRIKVITVEDPPEYLLVGATQVPVVRSRALAKAGDHQVNPFAAVVRAAMRSDPDLLLVGEVRDEASAELLKHAVQSGHQVFTTVHASGGIDIVARLRSNGVTDDVLGGQNFITALIYQTLLQKLCPHCSYGLDDLQRQSESDLAWEFIERVYRYLPYSLHDKLRFTNEDGCPHCTGGLIGRSVAAEVIIPDTYMLKCFRERQDSDALMHYRRRGGKIALEHGLLKALRGETDLRDVEKKLDQIAALEELEASVRTNFGMPQNYEFKIAENVFDEIPIGDDPNQIIAPKRVILDAYGRPLRRPGEAVVGPALPTPAPVPVTLPAITDLAEENPASVSDSQPAPAPAPVPEAAPLPEPEPMPVLEALGTSEAPGSLLEVFGAPQYKVTEQVTENAPVSAVEHLPADIVTVHEPKDVDMAITPPVIAQENQSIELTDVTHPEASNTNVEVLVQVDVGEDIAQFAGVPAATALEIVDKTVVRLSPRNSEEKAVPQVVQSQNEPVLEPEPVLASTPESIGTIEDSVTELDPISIELIRLLQRQVFKATPALSEQGVAEKIAQQLSRNLSSLAKMKNGFDQQAIERISSIAKLLTEEQQAVLKMARAEVIRQFLLPMDAFIAELDAPRAPVDGLKSKLLAHEKPQKVGKPGNVRSLPHRGKKGTNATLITVQVKRSADDAENVDEQGDKAEGVSSENNNNQEGS